VTFVVSGLFLSAVACSGGPDASTTASSSSGAGAGTGGARAAGAPAGDPAPGSGGATVAPSPGSGTATAPPRPKSPRPPTFCPTTPSPGATWTEIAPPAAPAGFAVTDAWAAGTDDIFFVGLDPSPDNGDTPPSQGRVLRWSHGCWTVDLLFPTQGFPKPQISGTATDDVWITAGNGIFHRDAAGWSPLDAALFAQIQPPAGQQLMLTDVQARTPDDVWFTDLETILHLVNGQWHKQQLSEGTPGASQSITFAFNVIFILGENDVWIGGGSDEVGSTVDPASLYHFDGQTWSIHNVGAFDVNALWPVGTDHAFWLAMPPDTVEPLAIREFPGDNVVITPGFIVPPVAGWMPGIQATSMWGRASSDIWVAGQDIAHFDGASWSVVADAPAAVRDVNDAFPKESVVIGDASATWLVGVGPRFFRKAAGAAP
jgi:hypothetical protein